MSPRTKKLVAVLALLQAGFNPCSFAQQLKATPPMPPSPVDQFRGWLGANDDQVKRALSQYPEEKRAVLLAKIKEYSSLPEQERERRLKMVELRLYLLPLMHLPLADRAEKLKQVPPSIKLLTLERLKQWDALHPATQKAVLESEWASRYFVRFQTSRPEDQARIFINLKPSEKAEVERKLAQWKQLPQQERLRRYSQFNAFFELPPEKQEKALGFLNEKERSDMEKTLKMFDQLNPEQRVACIESFRKFANMTPADRSLFLQNAERWKTMPPEDREAWRKLVESVPPLPTEMPPLPMDGADIPPLPIPSLSR
ncbi:MAG: DUF3106 domain-containing protein [Verrucomicrobiales bacterium]